MLAGIILAAGILLLIVAGYKALVVAKAVRRMHRRQMGFLNVSCAGDCGSAFEFILKMENGRVSHAEALGGRCAHSLICARAAARLAQGKTPAQIEAVTAHQIAQSAGGLSPEHMHCAVLAAHGLARAVRALRDENGTGGLAHDEAVGGGGIDTTHKSYHQGIERRS